ncbi:hypothetical protein [Robiginitalea sp. SC105]|uniref:hypothetical protein n=1 Tax=Robiginitalea sp. SC105 TaxID=2762332 RepID=UPI00163B5D58|nr:hypothetical protein [Robiginitalea sp. SC105]MBC2839063.1 hypothetical protein [Robiginitalea sp. SC105]
MHTRIFIVCLLVLAGACKEAPKQDEMPAEAAQQPPMDDLDRLAAAHGYGNWKDVSEIRFTFNVDRDTSHYERSWIWNPAENRVTRITATDTLTFLRSAVDSTLMDADAGFVNDKYWLLAPYQWMWDRNSFEWEMEEGAQAPISGKIMPKLTIVYGNEGGYTPGDAYDFYIGEDSLVAEWVFRRGNQPEPNLAATWEGYQTKNGLKISTMHQNPQGFKLYFTNVEVE